MQIHVLAKPLTSIQTLNNPNPNHNPTTKQHAACIQLI